MIQRLTKKQISKLGKKSSYKNKQSGGMRWNPFTKKSKKDNNKHPYLEANTNEIAGYANGRVENIVEPKPTWRQKAKNYLKKTFTRTKKSNSKNKRRPSKAKMRTGFNSQNSIVNNPMSEKKIKPNRHTWEQVQHNVQQFLNNKTDMPPHFIMSEEDATLHADEVIDLRSQVMNKMRENIQNPILKSSNKHRNVNTRTEALNVKEKPKNWKQKTRKYIGNTYTKTRDAIKRRFAKTKVKIDDFIEKLKELIRNFRNKSHLGNKEEEYLSGQFEFIVRNEANNETNNETNNLMQSTEQNITKTTRAPPILPPKTSTHEEQVPPTFYNNEIGTDESKVKEIIERINSYIQNGNHDVTINELGRLYTNIDGNMPNVSTNAKTVIDELNNKLNDIDKYFKEIKFDEKINNVSNDIKNLPDYHEYLVQIKIYKKYKENIFNILNRFMHNPNKTMNLEIDTIIKRNFKI